MGVQNCDDCADKRQLELIQRVGRVGYWEYDAATRSMYLPDASVALLRDAAGGTHESCMSLLDALPDAERRRFQIALDQATAQQLELNTELRLANGTPEGAHLMVRGAASSDGAGACRMAGTFQDISTGKRIESEREQLFTQMQALLDALPQGVSVIDRDLRLILWNRRFHEILGFPQSLVYRYARFEDFIQYNAMRGEYGPGDPQEQVQTIIDNFPGAISLFDADLKMAACNAQFKTLLDLPQFLFEKAETYFEDFIRFNAQRGEYGPGDVETLIAASLERARNFQAHHIERPRPGGKWLEITGTPIPSGGFVTSYIDITERKKVEERIRVLALQDGLTGLPNRLSLNEQLEQALERAAAGDQRLAVLFLDLDGFKLVNDTCGHDVGDALLVHVARMLQASVRQTDVVARLGGDEFVVLLHDVGPQATVAALADKIVSSVAQPCEVMGSRVQVGTSIGIAIYPDHARSREGLLKAADQAMYVAKTHGKGGYRFSAAGQDDGQGF